MTTVLAVVVDAYVALSTRASDMFLPHYGGSPCTTFVTVLPLSARDLLTYYPLVVAVRTGTGSVGHGVQPHL